MLVCNLFLASNAYCLASAVSSRLLEAIATAEGVNFEVRLMLFTARRYASVVYVIVVCLFVRHTPVWYQNG